MGRRVLQRVKKMAYRWLNSKVERTRQEYMDRLEGVSV